MTVAILSVTGHRPENLGGYAPVDSSKLRAFARECLVGLRPATVVTGMALGWDTAIAHACVDLGLPFIAAVPFVGQERKWGVTTQQEYRALLNRAQAVRVVCSGGYHPAKMQHRNEWMVDNSDVLLALWNGSSGGTANCVRYAQKRNKPTIQAWLHWERYR